jgi:transposase
VSWPCPAAELVGQQPNQRRRQFVHAQSSSSGASAWFLFLPKYSPDLNPIEMAFAKLKTLLRKAKARTYDDLIRAIGNICALFQPAECWTYLKETGYVAY